MMSPGVGYKAAAASPVSFIWTESRGSGRSQSPLFPLKMYKMCLAHLGLLLLALHLFSSQVVQAQGVTGAPTETNMTTEMYNMTSSTVNVTGDKNGCGNVDAFTLLLPLALGACLLHGWS